MNKNQRILYYVCFNALICVGLYLGIFTDAKSSGLVTVDKAILWIISLASLVMFPIALIANYATKPGTPPPEAVKKLNGAVFVIPLWFDTALDMCIVLAAGYAGWTATSIAYFIGMVLSIAARMQLEEMVGKFSRDETSHAQQ